MPFYKVLQNVKKKYCVLRFGLLDGELVPLEEVGKEFNVTRKRIRQIEPRHYVNMKNAKSLQAFNRFRK